MRKNRIYFSNLHKLFLCFCIVTLLAGNAYAMDFSYSQGCDNSASFDNEAIKEELTNIRRQLVAVSKNGYFNHLNGLSNEENIKLAKMYMTQNDMVRKKLKSYEGEKLDKQSRRSLKTLLAVTLYLEDMGENLVDYLSTSNPEERYDLYILLLDMNNFIKNILSE